MKSKIMTALLICASALILSGTVYAEETTKDGQPKDLSGKYFIQIAGKVGNGQDLHHGENDLAVTLDHSNVAAWEIKKVDAEGKDHVYTIAQGGKSFLSVKDGLAVCGDYKGEWVVFSNGPGKFSILWTEDDQKGGNALSIFPDNPVDLGHGNVSYNTKIARNNADGKGMDHQIWNLVAEADGGAAAKKARGSSTNAEDGFEGLAGKYAEPTGGKVELRKSDDAKQEAGPWRFVLLSGSTPGDWACAAGEDKSGEGKASVFTITFSEGPFKGSRYIIVSGKDGKVKELQGEKGNKTIWTRQSTSR